MKTLFSQKKIAFITLIAQGLTVLSLGLALTVGTTGAFTTEGWERNGNSTGDMVGFTVIPGLNIPGNTGNTTGGTISSSYASPSTFDPYSQQTTIYYTVTEAAVVDVDILSGSSIVKTLYDNANATPGTNSAIWNGKLSSGSIVQPGTYTYRIKAYFGNGTNYTKTGNVTVQYANYNGGGSNQGANVTISNVSVSPSTFDQNSQSTTVYYTLNTTAYVTVQVLNSSSGVIRNLKTNVSESGSKSASWNGAYENGVKVANGTYTFKIYAYATNGSNDIKSATVQAQANYDGGSNTVPPAYIPPSYDCNYYGNCGNSGNYGYGYPNITAVYTTVYSNSVTIHYYLSNAAYVTLKVNNNYSGSNDQSQYLVNYQWQSSGYHTATWYPGTNYNNYNYNYNYNTGNSGYHTFEVKATNNSGTDYETGSFNFSGTTSGGYYTGAQSCAGFYDVGVGSPYCKAIQAMKELGIFIGYTDGSFKPDQPINRAETVKVMLKAFGKYIYQDNYSNLGFWDVQPGAWYMPYLRTAQKLGIIAGYPDKTFRPGQVVNRVELLKIFFKTADITLPSCNQQPYIDTPINNSTVWYIDYVCYAKSKNLIGSFYSFTNGIYQNFYFNGDNFNYNSSFFQPNKAMTRADVAELFYRAQLKGIVPSTGTQNYTEPKPTYCPYGGYYMGNQQYCY